RIEDEVFAISQHVAAALAALRETNKAVAEATSMSLLGTLADVQKQLSGLVYPGFIARTPPSRIPHLVRYIRAAQLRIDKAQANPRGDEAHAWAVQELTAEWESARRSDDGTDLDRSARIAEVRWQLEELRVSLFA